MITCAICGKPIDPLVLQFQRNLEPRVISHLQSSDPAWTPEEPVCPDCVYREVERAGSGHSDSKILPTAVRLHSNPLFTGQGVTVALLDSGFYPHPDLVRPTNRVVAYVDATGSEPVVKSKFKRPHITSWHGLMTSSVAAGSGFMSEGLYGSLARRANLVLVKTGNQRNRRIREQDIYRALNWVVANQHRYQIRVVNISLGGDRPTNGEPSRLDELVEEAVARGMVVVAAVGNGNAQRIIPPASAVSAITVGGLDDQNTLDARAHRMYWSNYGYGVNHRPKPDILAPAIWLAAPMLPGTSVHNEALFLFQLERMTDQELARSLDTEYAQSRFRKETLRQPLSDIRLAIRRRMLEQKFIHPHYQHVDGTSFAAPIVSSVVAQMLEANPALTPAQVKQLLIQTARPLENVPRERQGYGVVDAARAVAAALRQPGAPMVGLPLSPYLTTRKVSFYYYNRHPEAVRVVGTFNRWQTRGSAMKQATRGVWILSVPRPPPGVYRYKFLLDQDRWVDDPENPARVEDGYGGFHSLLIVHP